MTAPALVRYTDPELERDRERARSWVELMAPAAELAKAIAPTDFVPRALRHNPAAITAAILYGDEVGLGPMQSLSKIAVIDGRPFIAAEAQRALVLAAGHELWLEEITSAAVTWCGRRRGSDQVTRVTWTLEDARRARLEAKPNWRAYPRQMLSARASAELVRAVFADVIGGLGATEELEGLELELEAPDAPAKTSTRKRPKVRGAAVPVGLASEPRREVEAVELPPLPGDEPDELEAKPEPMTRRQNDRMRGLFRQLGITDRAEMLKLAREVTGRQLGSSKELTAAEADRVLVHLEAMHPAPEVDVEALQAQQAELDAEVTAANARLHEHAVEQRQLEQQELET